MAIRGTAIAGGRGGDSVRHRLGARQRRQAGRRRRGNRHGRPLRRAACHGELSGLRPLLVCGRHQRQPPEGAPASPGQRPTARPRDRRAVPERLGIRCGRHDRQPAGRRPEPDDHALRRSHLHQPRPAMARLGFQRPRRDRYSPRPSCSRPTPTSVRSATTSTCAPAPIFEDWAERLGYGHTTGLDIPGEAAGLRADSGLAVPDLHKKDRPQRLADRQPLEAQRRHQPGPRPRQPAGHPFTSGRVLRDDCQRRLPRDSPSRPAHRLAR